MKNKIGIVTLYYKNYNYGGLLQAYAMQKIFSVDDCNASLISIYTSSRSWQKIFSIGVKKVYKNIIQHIKFIMKQKNSIFNEKYKARLSKFENFIDSIPHTSYIKNENIQDVEEKFDFFVCGSDQVWNPEWWNEILFLQFTDKPKMAYAASVGRSSLSDHQINYLREHVKKYTSVSVREIQTQRFLKKHIPKLDIKFVLDPTMLIEKAEWQNLATHKIITEKYVFVYNVGDASGLRQCIYETSKRNGYKVISIGYAGNKFTKNEENYSDEVVIDAGISEWLGLIRDASVVFTDSFHGSVFSIIFHKLFWNYTREDSINQNVRLHSLLEVFGLYDRHLSRSKSFDEQIFLKKIDYDLVDKKLEEYKKISEDFIHESIKKMKQCSSNGKDLHVELQ